MAGILEKKFFERFIDEYNSLDSQDYSSLLDLIRRVVKDTLGKSRSGILLALEDFGYDSEGYITGYHRIGTNEIYLNRNLLQIMRNDEIPEAHFKAYLFHLLLHKYIHSIGIIDEEKTRMLTRKITIELFGKTHPVTKIAIFGCDALFPYSFYQGHFDPEEHIPMNVKFIQLHHQDSRLTYI